MEIETRKGEHIEICLRENVRANYNFWDDIILLHNALPEINLPDIKLDKQFMDKKLNAPFLIAPMSGGHKSGKIVNRNCAEVASEMQIGFCIGSQRAALIDPKLTETYSVIKEYDIPFVCGNIGASQLIKQKDRDAIKLDEISKLMDMINAHALIVHLNYPQEVIQPEGNENAHGVIDVLEKLCSSFTVIVKECGSGITKDLASKLKSVGVKAIDISGVGGISWVAVEYYRARARGAKKKMELGKLLWDWGIPSPISVLECKDILPTIASGGVRSGLDIARGIALGAEVAAMAGNLLEEAYKSPTALKQKLENVFDQLRTVMFLVGAKDVNELKKAKFVLVGKTKEWLEASRQLTKEAK